MERAKGELRRRMRSVAPPTPSENAAVVDELVDHFDALPPSSVLTFLSMNTEIDLATLPLRSPNHRWLVTRTPQHGWLTVHDLDAPRELHPFGFEQPIAVAQEIEPEEVDIVLVPGLAFDRTGGRLGRGRGYYDQLIGRCRRDVVTIGVTLDRCVVDRVPVLGHDRRVEWLVTESGMWSTRP